MNSQSLEEIILELRTENAQLRATIAAQNLRIAELEARLKQNSSNSHRPPSTDGPDVKPAPPRTPSGRKRGAQPGHDLFKRQILTPDEIHEHKPQCQCCGTQLHGDDPKPIVDQVIELPAKLRHVVHHRRHRLTCPKCGIATTAAPVPEAASGFGPRLQAHTAYLSAVGRLSKRTIQTYYADVYDIPMSLGGICKHDRKTSDAIEPIYQEALNHTQGLDANVDETGWKQGRTKAWLWVAVTAVITVFVIRLKRNRAAFDDLVGPKPGVLTTVPQKPLAE